MTLPKIELSSTPDTDLLTGPFGRLAGGFQATCSGNRIVDLVTCFCEVLPPQGLV